MCVQQSHVSRTLSNHTNECKLAALRGCFSHDGVSSPGTPLRRLHVASVVLTPQVRTDLGTERLHEMPQSGRDAVAVRIQGVRRVRHPGDSPVERYLLEESMDLALDGDTISSFGLGTTTQQ